jgi:hypothetical protein
MRAIRLINFAATVAVVFLFGCSGWRGHSSEETNAYGEPVHAIGVTWSDRRQARPGIDVGLKPDETPPVQQVPEFDE